MNENKLIPSGQTSPFDRIRQINEQGEEFWSARDLQEPLGYEQWRRFEETIERAMIACQNSGYEASSNFANVGKLQNRGNRGGTQEIQDYRLTRFACYLTAMNGDPRKSEIAAAQTYFAIKTREAETAQPIQAPAQLALNFDFNLRIQTPGDLDYAEAVINAAKSAVNANMYLQGLLNGTVEPKIRKRQAKSVQNEIIRVIKHLHEKGEKPPTIRDLGRYLTRIDHETLYIHANELVTKGIASVDNSGKSPRYNLIELEIAVS